MLNALKRLCAACLTLLAMTEPALSQSVAAVNDKLDAIEKYLTQSEANGFAGAVLIAQGDNILLQKGYGLADRATNRPNTSDTIFDIGSVTKQFTGAAIVKLVEQGKLDVADTLSAFFADLPADKRNITLHQLLTHSSGIREFMGRGDFDHMPMEAYFNKLFSSDLDFEPGSRYRYTNAGFSILARVVELASGQPYEAFVNEHLLTPAGMTSTGYLLPDWDNERLAKGYRFSAFDKGSMASRYASDGKISRVLMGNGGLNSTLEDMHKWYRALETHKVLSKSSVATLTAPYVKENPEGSSHYAYGWAIFTSARDTKIIAHNGSNGTFYCDFVWFPEDNLLITYATNALVEDAMGLGIHLENLWFEPDYTPPPFAFDPVAEVIDMALNHQGDSKALTQKIRSEMGGQLTRKFMLNRAGLGLLQHDYVNQAIAVLELNPVLFPGDGNLWDSLGEAYLAGARFDKAIVAFDKALALGAEAERCFWCDNAAAKREIAINKQQNRS